MQEIGADLTDGTDSVIHGHQWHLELLQLRMGVCRRGRPQDH